MAITIIMDVAQFSTEPLFNGARIKTVGARSLYVRRIVGRVVVYYVLACLVLAVGFGEMAFRIPRLPVADRQSFQAAAAGFGADLQDGCSG